MADEPNPEMGPCEEIVLRWYPKVQQVELKFDAGKFRRWEFILAVIGMGHEVAESSLKLWRMQQVAQQQQEQMAAAMQEHSIRQALSSGKHKGGILQV